MTRKKLAIYGGGGLGRELKVWMEKIPGYDFIGFLDDNLSAELFVDHAPVIGGISSIASYEELYIVIGVGDPGVRKIVADKLSTFRNVKYPVMVHPKAIIEGADTITFDEGAIITAGCVLTTGITIGKHVLINLNTSIGHDCVIDDFSCIMPGVNISGAVKIGSSVLIGTGASVLNNLSIGDRSKIGAGAVVVKSIPEGCTAVGVPAKILST
jgi:sugar O-acyltransferase (sialic acid O-acetyltransferase NeuD family)